MGQHDERATAKRTSTASIQLPPDQIRLLKHVAFVRTRRERARASLSSVVSELIEQNRAELEREAKE